MGWYVGRGLLRPLSVPDLPEFDPDRYPAVHDAVLCVLAAGVDAAPANQFGSRNVGFSGAGGCGAGTHGTDTPECSDHRATGGVVVPVPALALAVGVTAAAGGGGLRAGTHPVDDSQLLGVRRIRSGCFEWWRELLSGQQPVHHPLFFRRL